MRISFDLDETLLSRHVDWEVEPGLKGFREDEEFLRKGVVDLFKWLRGHDHEIWIYTNSYRGFKSLEGWFEECGVPVDRVINQVIHDEKRVEEGMTSDLGKVPNWFGIDMHFDDSLELAKQDNVFRIDPLDTNWVDTVKQCISNHRGGGRRNTLIP